MTDNQREEFEELSKHLIKWLCNNGHPHMTIVINQTSAELLEGQMVITTGEFVR